MDYRSISPEIIWDNAETKDLAMLQEKTANVYEVNYIANSGQTSLLKVSFQSINVLQKHQLIFIAIAYEYTPII